MNLLLGIDLGTSSLKAMVIDENGNTISLHAKDYSFSSPVNGYAEQDPEEWWDTCVDVLGRIFAGGVSPSDIKAIGFSGQMHGVVMLDGDKKSLRPAILHCDARSGEEVDILKSVLGENAIRDILMNPLYTGFMAVSLYWVKRHEPEIFAGISHVMSPKDYIKFKFCGEIFSDYSDAAATLCFDIKECKWSEQILKKLEFPMEWFPKCYDSTEIIGKITKNAAALTGLAEGTFVASGGADQVMQSIGNGVIREGMGCSNIGTAGQISFLCERPLASSSLSTNMFCSYRKGKWYSMAGMMNAGLCYNWFSHLFETVDYAGMNPRIGEIAPGSGGLLFLPYLNGERTPHFNPDISGIFMGLTVNADRVRMSRAVMEGVTFAMNDCLRECLKLGLKPDTIIASGGAARSKEWLQIQADIYGYPIKVADTNEQACLGAAITAGVAAGIYKDVEEGCERTVRYKDFLIEPVLENQRIYEVYYELFREAYRSSSKVLSKLTLEGRKTKNTPAGCLIT